MAERNRADEMIRGLASFSEMNPIVGMDAQGVITCANSATQKTYKDLGVLKNPSLFVPDDKEEILHLKESTKSQIYWEIALKTACFSENITPIRESQDVNFRYIFFYQTYKEEIKQLTGQNLAIGTSNREGD